jgi:hypothetical protein
VPATFWILPLVWAAVYLLPPLNFDVSLILSVADRWLGGERLYVDLIDVNPPLIFALNLIPAGIARLTGASAPIVLVLCILTLVAAAVWLSVKVLPAALGERDATVRMALVPLILFALVIFPGEMFGQREHLMLVTLFPYTLLATARGAGVFVPRGRRLAIAILAAFGFALKPHFLAIPALIELYVLLQRGPKAWLRDFVPWVMLAIFVAYAIAAWEWTPEYFTQVLPLVMSTYSKIGGASPMVILLGNQLGPALLLIVPLGAVAFLVPLSPLIRKIVLAALGAAASGVLQDKGWPYHLFPAQALALVLAGLTVAATFDWFAPVGDGGVRTGVSLPARAVVGAMLLIFISFTVNIRATFYDQWGFSDSPSGQLLRIVEANAPEGSYITIISPGVYPHFPMLNYAHDKLGMGFQTIWPLQGAYEDCTDDQPRYHSREDMPASERALDQDLIQHFVKDQPPLVIIDKVAGIKRCANKDFDLLEYFLRQPAFAEEMEHYDLLLQYDRYIIFKRRPDGDDESDQ